MIIIVSRLTAPQLTATRCKSSSPSNRSYTLPFPSVWPAPAQMVCVITHVCHLLGSTFAITVVRASFGVLKYKYPADTAERPRCQPNRKPST